MNVNFTQRNDTRWIVSVDRNQIARIDKHKQCFFAYAHDGGLIGTTLSIEVMQDRLRRKFSEC